MGSHYLREMVHAPVEVTRNFYRYRHILRQMVAREIKGRFAGSAGGFLWNFVHPILMLVTYLVVFVYIFKLRVGSGGGSGASALYLMAGLFPWIIIAEGLSRGTSSLIENANLIQKTSFPIEILAAKAVFTPFFSYGTALLLLTLYKVFSTGSFSVMLVLPAIIAIQFFFTLGIVLLTSTLSVFFRDILQLMTVLITFWIYLTPVLYTLSMIPVWAQKLMNINPLFPIITVYQDIFIRSAVTPMVVCYAFLWSAGLFILGSFVFIKLKNEFADWL